MCSFGIEPGHSLVKGIRPRVLPVVKLSNKLHVRLLVICCHKT